MRRTSSTSRASAIAACSLALGACGTSTRLEDARAETARVQLHTMEMAAELAYMKTGAYPESLEKLDVKRHDDPWGRPFVYALTGSGAEASIDLSSMGPDGAPNTADDVRVKAPEKAP